MNLINEFPFIKSKHLKSQIDAVALRADRQSVGLSIERLRVRLPLGQCGHCSAGTAAQ